MNKLNRNLKKLDAAPKFLRPWLIDRALGSAVKFVGTAGLHFEKLGQSEVVVCLANKTRVQNHIGQIHAAATVLLAETATGIAVGLNIPDNKLPLMKQLTVAYTKRSDGKQTATASVSLEMKKRLETEDKGSFLVPVSVVDSKGAVIVEAQMEWAWILKNK